MCNPCCIVLDYVTEPERLYILAQINQGNTHPGCCWLWDPSVRTCRIHGNPEVSDSWGPAKDKYQGAA